MGRLRRIRLHMSLLCLRAKPSEGSPWDHAVAYPPRQRHSPPAHDRPPMGCCSPEAAGLTWPLPLHFSLRAHWRRQMCDMAYREVFGVCLVVLPRKEVVESH
jgi:hypothetical protein